MAHQLVLMHLQLCCNTAHFKTACLSYYKDAQAPAQTHMRRAIECDSTACVVLYNALAQQCLHLRNKSESCSCSVRHVRQVRAPSQIQTEPLAVTHRLVLMQIQLCSNSVDFKATDDSGTFPCPHILMTLHNSQLTAATTAGTAWSTPIQEQLSIIRVKIDLYGSNVNSESFETTKRGRPLPPISY